MENRGTRRVVLSRYRKLYPQNQATIGRVYCYKRATRRFRFFLFRGKYKIQFRDFLTIKFERENDKIDGFVSGQKKKKKERRYIVIIVRERETG